MKFVILLGLVAATFAGNCASGKKFSAATGNYVFKSGGYSKGTCEVATGTYKDAKASKPFTAADLDGQADLHTDTEKLIVKGDADLSKWVKCAKGFKGTPLVDCDTDADKPGMKGCAATGDCGGTIPAYGAGDDMRAAAFTVTGTKTQGSTAEQPCKDPCTGNRKFTCGDGPAWIHDGTSKCTCPSWTITPAKCDVPKCKVAAVQRKIACSTGADKDADCANKYGNGAKATDAALKCPAGSDAADCKDKECVNTEAWGDCIKTGTTGNSAGGVEMNGKVCTLGCGGSATGCSEANKVVTATWILKSSGGGGSDGGSGSTMNSAFAVVALVFAYLW